MPILSSLCQLSIAIKQEIREEGQGTERLIRAWKFRVGAAETYPYRTPIRP